MSVKRKRQQAKRRRLYHQELARAGAISAQRKAKKEAKAKAQQAALQVMIAKQEAFMKAREKTMHDVLERDSQTLLPGMLDHEQLQLSKCDCGTDAHLAKLLLGPSSFCTYHRKFIRWKLLGNWVLRGSTTGPINLENYKWEPNFFTEEACQSMLDQTKPEELTTPFKTFTASDGTVYSVTEAGEPDMMTPSNEYKDYLTMADLVKAVNTMNEAQVNAVDSQPMAIAHPFLVGDLSEGVYSNSQVYTVSKDANGDPVYNPVTHTYESGELIDVAKKHLPGMSGDPESTVQQMTDAAKYAVAKQVEAWAKKKVVELGGTPEFAESVVKKLDWPLKGQPIKTPYVPKGATEAQALSVPLSYLDTEANVDLDYIKYKFSYAAGTPVKTPFKVINPADSTV